MADLNDFRAKIEQLKAAVRARLPEVATVLTLSAKAIAERKIKEKGFGESYSQVEIPAWFLHGKELNASGAAFIEKKIHAEEPKDRFTNWGELRAAQGLQTGHVDLSYTNKMFANMQPLQVRQNGDIYSAPLGASNTEAQNKMNWNHDRYGDFIGKSIDEEDKKTLSIVVTDQIKQVIDDIQLKP